MDESKMKRKISSWTVLQSICMLGALISITAGYWSQSMNTFALGLLFIYLNSMLFALKKWNKRFVFGMLHVTFFTFLLSRPIIGMFRGTKWWNASSQQAENIWFALGLLFLALISLFAGGVIIEKYDDRKQKSRMKAKAAERSKDKSLVAFLQLVSLCVFGVSIIFYLIQQIEPLLIIGRGNYLEYYNGFQSKLPGIIHTIASFHKYSLCIFLATLPKKGKTFVPLAIFEISAIPSLLLGLRNLIMLNSLFILIYYWLRDKIREEDEKKWLGKIESILLIITIPGTLIFMAVYAPIRVGNAVSIKNPFMILTDFFIGQGVSFDAMAIAYGYRAGIRTLRPKNYTFGGMIDYIKHGTIGQKLFGSIPIPSGNNEIAGKISNNFSHNFSYISYPEEYFKGHGRGSSYILETYFDFGYIGVIIFSIILGIITIAMVHWFGKKVLSSTIILICLTTIFFIPRAEATGWLTFIVTLQFWACVGACYLGAFICTKCDWIQKILKFLHLYPKECQGEIS